jgi:nitrite reductase (NO-forming)
MSKNKYMYITTLVLFLMSLCKVAIACDECQRGFQERLLQGKSGSLHQAELVKLMNTTQSNIGQANPESLLPISLEATTGNASRNNNGNKLTPNSPKVNEVNKQVYGKLPSTGYVAPGTKPDKSFTIKMSEGETFLGNGVMYKGFLIDGKIPGPTLIADEGDVIEFTVDNQGTVPHGVSIHAAYTQTSKYFGKIPPGEKRTHLFRAVYPGVYMYHCAPGGHAIPMHVLLGQYGMMIIRPKKEKYRMEVELGKKPDIELYLLQHELYASGKEATEGKALYTMFNGKLFRYAESPIKARPGDFVRIYFLNVGPNNLSTFHLVGIIWDYAYWQGIPSPSNTFVGGQTVLAGPSDSWVIDFRVPNDEGAYLMLTHAVGSATRGAIGILKAEKNIERSLQTLADGPSYTKEELEAAKAKAVRFISPHEPGSDDLRNPVRIAPEQKNATVLIQGNSYYPKVIEVTPGTTIEWVNEDVFTYFDGEFAGIHNVVGIKGPESFASPMLGHAERFSVKFTKEGEYSYMCTPHPYMKGIVRVVDK